MQYNTRDNQTIATLQRCNIVITRLYKVHKSNQWIKEDRFFEVRNWYSEFQNDVGGLYEILTVFVLSDIRLLFQRI